MLASPITFTIEDFIGAIVPGMVWSVEFFTINELLAGPIGDVGKMAHRTSVVPSTFDVAITYSSLSSSLQFFAGFVICSFILGYISNAFPTQLSENLSTIICKPLKRILRLTNLDGKFPYDEFHKSQDYYKTLENTIIERFGCARAPDENGIFASCKKMLKTDIPDRLWEKTVHMEAQCRMLSSLLLASLGNIALILIAILENICNLKSPLAGLLLWFGLSLLFTTVIAYTFQYRRRQEVKSIYSYTLLYAKKVGI
jgi:hypothetical protein